MFMGVPYTPFFIAAGTCLVLAAYINVFFLLLLPPALFILRQIAKHDEMIFRLWGMRMRMMFKVRNRRLYKDMWSFSPNQYRRDLQDSVQEADAFSPSQRDGFDFNKH